MLGPLSYLHNGLTLLVDVNTNLTLVIGRKSPYFVGLPLRKR